MSLNLLSGHSDGLELLDWSTIISKIKNYASFEKTKEILELPPKVKSFQQINNNYETLANIIANLEIIQNTFQQGITNISKNIDNHNIPNLLEKGHVLDITQLNYLANLIEFFKPMYRLLKGSPILNNYNIDLTKNDFLTKTFIRRFRKIVDPNGDTHFEQHPQLAKLIGELHDYERRLRESIRNLALSDLYKDSLQYEQHDVVHDRYVLALRSDNYKNDHGVIVAKSSSGMTLFVEPYEMREKSNRRMRILAEIEEIINKLCSEFCEILLKGIKEIKNYSYFIIDVDKYLSKASFCHRLDLRRPRLHQDFHFKLENYFHPLIENPITNHIEIKDENLGFVISGPNTGGKTVTLKCIALCQLFLHYGLFLPIGDGDISPMHSIYYFSHDHQDLTQGLSSFASETKNYLQLLNEIKDSSLIIIDEIFNSTSSEEASALAIGLLEEIHNKSYAKVIISTHHQLFKTLIHKNDAYISGHVSFDLESQSPTYRLIQGQPGSSMALSIFDKLSESYNQSSNITKIAKNSLDKKYYSYEKLLQDVSQKENELQSLLAENRRINLELKNQKQSMEGILFLEKQKTLENYKKDLDNILRKAENLASEIKKGEITSTKDFSKKKRGILSQMPNKQKYQDAKQTNFDLKEINFNNVKVGDTLFHSLLKKNVQVKSINARKKELQVTSGKMTMWTKASQLYLPQKGSVKKPEVHVNVFRESVQSVEIDTRGLRLEEFQRKSLNAIDELIAGSIPFLNIIHGHGAGVLKSWLRDHIKKHPKLTWENDEGNDGCTKVILKDN